MRLRRWFWRHVARWGGELCGRCGRNYYKTGIWHADDVLWGQVVRGRWGLLCPRCFDALADVEHSWLLIWRPTYEPVKSGSSPT